MSENAPERYVIFVNEKFAERSPVFVSFGLATAWLNCRKPNEGYRGATVKNVRQEANRLRRLLRDVNAQFALLDGAIGTPNSLKRRRNRLRREAQTLSAQISALNAIRHPANAELGNTVRGGASTLGPYSKYGTSSYVTIVSGGFQG